jgi:hypothetical protein
MSAEKRARERESLDSIRANETKAQCDEKKRKEREQSATHWQNLTDEMRAKRRKYMCDYMRKKRSKATLPPSPEEEEADAMADPPPSPEQDAEVMEAVDILTTLNEASSYETQSCRHRPSATMAAAHGAEALPWHVLGGPAHPPVVVGPRRRSELVEGALHAKLPMRVQVRTVEADDGQDGMWGHRA